MRTKEKGDLCESLVADYLTVRGHKILARNYRCPYGEIDILSLRGSLLCVTEVKSLSATWPPDDLRYMVSPAKRIRLRKTLTYFLSQDENEKLAFNGIRFDAAAVTDGKVAYYDGVS